MEAVRQVRGTSPNPVPGAEVALLLGGPMAPLVSANHGALDADRARGRGVDDVCQRVGQGE